MQYGNEHSRDSGIAEGQTRNPNPGISGLRIKSGIAITEYYYYEIISISNSSGQSPVT